MVWDFEGQIHGAVLDRNLDVLDQGPIRVSAEAKAYPAADGDGNQWLVAYATLAGLKCVPVFWDEADGMAWVGSETVLLQGAAGAPSVGWMGESYVVSSGGVLPASFAAHSVDPFTCLPCERSFPITASIKMIATQKSGDPTAGDLAFLVDDLGIVQRYRADDGITTDLGGGCGGGGWSAASCAIVGNAAFTLRLREAQRGVPAFLALGLPQPQLGYVCGPCTLVPNPLVVVGVGLTDSAHGNAELGLPLANTPSLIGATFLMQWLTVAGTTCPLGLQFSNALQVQLQ